MRSEMKNNAPAKKRLFCLLPKGRILEILGILQFTNSFKFCLRGQGA